VFYPVGISVPLLETAVFGCGAWSRCADAVISQFTLQHHTQVTLALSIVEAAGGGRGRTARLVLSEMAIGVGNAVSCKRMSVRDHARVTPSGCNIAS
jgi:hypothetical protein